MKNNEIHNLLQRAVLELDKAVKDLKDARSAYQKFFLSVSDVENALLLQLQVSDHLTVLEDGVASLFKYQHMLSKLDSKYSKRLLLERFLHQNHLPEASDFQVLASLLEKFSLKFEPEYEDMVQFIVSIYDTDKDFGQTVLLFLQRALKKIRHTLDGIISIRNFLLQAELIAANQSQELPEQNWDFVKQPELREILRRDYAELNKLLGVKAYKSSLIMCGSILEAVLVDVLREHEASAMDAYRELYAKKGNYCPPIEQWKLFQLISVSEILGKLDGDSRRQADILRDYRNLIHPTLETRRATMLDEELVFAEVSLLKRILKLLSNSAQT